jgi:hypothetical protein
MPRLPAKTGTKGTADHRGRLGSLHGPEVVAMAAGQLDPPADGPTPRRSTPGRRPLARRTDRVEATTAVLLLTLAFALIFAGWLAGVATREQAVRHEADLGPRHPVSAVMSVPPAGDPNTAAGGGPVTATARWLGADGLEHFDTVMVSYPAPAVSTVTIWVNEHDEVAPPPADAHSAVVAGVVVGILVVAAGWSMLFACWLVVRRAIERVNHARWADEWSRVEPLWSGRAGRGA